MVLHRLFLSSKQSDRYLIALDRTDALQFDLAPGISPNSKENMYVRVQSASIPIVQPNINSTNNKLVLFTSTDWTSAGQWRMTVTKLQPGANTYVMVVDWRLYTGWSIGRLTLPVVRALTLVIGLDAECSLKKSQDSRGPFLQIKKNIFYIWPKSPRLSHIILLYDRALNPWDSDRTPSLFKNDGGKKDGRIKNDGGKIDGRIVERLRTERKKTGGSLGGSVDQLGVGLYSAAAALSTSSTLCDHVRFPHHQRPCPPQLCHHVASARAPPHGPPRKLRCMCPPPPPGPRSAESSKVALESR
ncbi:hypothetical protein T492DRAFT_1115128 [Pavlovales sp. CCMP2436]|nr:hypothetical protein T492DRAFT_1115128 [Pavlovales sp. CCMP2436]